MLLIFEGTRLVCEIAFIPALIPIWLLKGMVVWDMIPASVLLAERFTAAVVNVVLAMMKVVSA